MENQGLAHFDTSFLYKLWNRIEFDWMLPSSKIHNRELSYISDQQFTELQLSVRLTFLIQPNNNMRITYRASV